MEDVRAINLEREKRLKELYEKGRNMREEQPPVTFVPGRNVLARLALAGTLAVISLAGLVGYGCYSCYAYRGHGQQSREVSTGATAGREQTKAEEYLPGTNIIRRTYLVKGTDTINGVLNPDAKVTELIFPENFSSEQYGLIKTGIYLRKERRGLVRVSSNCYFQAQIGKKFFGSARPGPPQPIKEVSIWEEEGVWPSTPTDVYLGNGELELYLTNITENSEPRENHVRAEIVEVPPPN